MINLLPPKQKEEVFNEKKERTILNLMFFLVVFLLFSTTTFYIAKYYSLETLKAEKKVFDQEINKLSAVADLEKDIEKLNSMSLNIKEIDSQNLNLKNSFEEAQEVLPGDIKLNDFNYKKDNQTEQTVYQITLSGDASNWQSLLTFEEKLKESFSAVEFSEDSWSQVEDINFLVKFKINGENK